MVELRKLSAQLRVDDEQKVPEVGEVKVSPIVEVLYYVGVWVDFLSEEVLFRESRERLKWR